MYSGHDLLNVLNKQAFTSPLFTNLECAKRQLSAEAELIDSLGYYCISKSSIAFSCKELTYLYKDSWVFEYCASYGC